MIQLFKDKKYWREMGIILLFGILINIACFCMPMITHAQGYETEYFPIVSGYNPNNYPIDDSYLRGLFSDPTVCMIKVYWENSVSHPDWYSIYVLHDSSVTQATPFFLYGEVYTSNPSRFDVRSSSNISGIYVESYQYRDGAWSNLLNRWDNSFANFTNISSTNADPRTIYYVKENLNKDSSNGLTLIYGMVTEIIVPGEFTDLPPIEDILNNISGSYTPHSNNTPPTYDNNLSDGENISNAITGHSNNMNNAINNLGENIKNFFNKLYEKLTNVGNKISQNIYNGFSTLMQNIKDFFGPKLDSINDKLGQLVDHISQDEEESQQEIQTALQGTTFYQDFDDMKGLVTDSVAIWNSTSAPSEYKIPFHVERIAILNCDEVQYIDLSLFSPVFPYLRGVMWALVTYSLVYTVIDSIASYISGGDE